MLHIYHNFKRKCQYKRPEMEDEGTAGKKGRVGKREKHKSSFSFHLLTLDFSYQREKIHLWICVTYRQIETRNAMNISLAI